MRIGVDLSGIDLSYSGGVSTFSMGLTAGLCQSALDGETIVLLATADGCRILRNPFEPYRNKIEWLIVQRPTWERIVLRFIRIASYLSGAYGLRQRYDRVAVSGLNRIIGANVDMLVVPTTHLNFYALTIPVALCVHDIQHEYMPQNFSLRDRIARWSSYRASCAAATKVQASSNFIKTCLLDKFAFLDEEKIFVSFEGVDIERYRDGFGSRPPNFSGNSEPFLFYPAQLWPHKNHLLLLRALKAFKDVVGSEVKCVLTGQDYGSLPLVTAEIRALGLQKVQYLGKVAFNELIYLYNQCSAVMALGLHESSSLVVREAAVFGKPIICSDIPPNVEAKEQINLLLFDRFDPLDLMAKIREALSGAAEIMEAAQENRSKVTKLAWDVLARDYVRALSHNMASRETGPDHRDQIKVDGAS